MLSCLTLIILAAQTALSTREDNPGYFAIIDQIVISQTIET